MGWFIYFGIILAASLVLGWHLGRFRNACTEMTGMMAGMTIGMLGGFALGYGMAAAVGRDIFIGNLVGVILGAVLGGWFGRAGELMGIMDGAMGGVMGGSMGAMIASMIYVDWKLQWTGVLFGGAYVAGALALTALIESRSPDHEHLHWLLPKLSRARRSQPLRVASGSRVTNAGKRATASSSELSSAARSSKVSKTAAATVPARQTAVTTTWTTSGASQPKPTPAAPAHHLRDYYALLRVEKSADLETIEDAYLNLLATAGEDKARLVDRAFTILRDPQRRARYDSALEESRKASGQTVARPAPRSVAAVAPVPAAGSEPGDCCPPPKKKAQAPGPVHAGVSATHVPRVVTYTAPSVPVAASVASNTTRTTGRNMAATTAPAPAPARQPGQLPSLKSANAAFASAHAGIGQISSQNKGHTNASNKKSGKHAAQGAAQHGSKHNTRKGPSVSRDAYYGSEDYSYPQSKRRRRRYEYAEPDNSFAKRTVIGAAIGATAMLLVFWLAFGTAGGASGASGVQTTQGSYDNPADAVYHAPGAVPSAAQLEGQAVAATVGADGVQTANLTLDERTSSYSPAAIKVKKGVPVRLNLTTNGGGRDCRSVVDIPTLGARGFIEGGAGTMELTPAQEGVYEFNCPMRMVNPSYLVVTN